MEVAWIVGGSGQRCVGFQSEAMMGCPGDGRTSVVDGDPGGGRREGRPHLQSSLPLVMAVAVRLQPLPMIQGGGLQLLKLRT